MHHRVSPLAVAAVNAVLYLLLVLCQRIQFMYADPFDNIFSDLNPAIFLLFIVSGVVGLVFISLRPHSSLLVRMILYVWGICFAAFMAYVLVALYGVVLAAI
jgi:hypothetical protein